MKQVELQFDDHERQERLRQFVNRTGYWFASCESFEEDAERACKLGFLQPVDNLLDAVHRNKNSRAFFVRAQLRSIQEIPASLYRLLVEGMKC